MSPARPMVTVTQVRDAARRRFDRDCRGWAASAAVPEGGVGEGGAPDGAVSPVLSIPLHPPTQRQVLADLAGVRAWIAHWAAADDGYVVTWESRTWPTVGAQQVPVRCVINGADDIARVARELPRWTTMRDRVMALGDRFGRVDDHGDPLRAALRRHAAAIGALAAADFDRLLGVLDWVIEHPASGWFIRALPIRGVDTKWVGTHRSMVEDLHSALTGRASLGLSSAPTLIRLRVLDEGLAPGGLRDLALPVGELRRWSPAVTSVLVLENLETIAALPDIQGTVAIHGSGYAVSRLGRIEWIATSAVRYWGDLDSNGFAILNQIRGSCENVESLLMDSATLLAHRDLWVVEEKPNRGRFTRLTEAEQETLAYLRENGDLRLEQERIAWQYALAAILNP